MDRITVQRGNVVLDIKPDDKEHYRKIGFSVIDASGKVTEGPLNTDNIGELKVRIGELTKQLEEANKVIAEQKKTIEKLSNKKKDDKKA